MSKRKRSKRNKDFRSAKGEVPFVQLDYKWTLGCAKEKVADTTVYESPELHLPGATFNFIFEVDNDGSERDQKNRLFVVNNSESSVQFSGVAAYDPQHRLEVQKEVHPGIIGLLDFDGRAQVAEFRFDLRVYGLEGDGSKCEGKKKREKRHRKLTKNLLQSVKNMWFDPGEFSDVHINVGDETIRAHKFVLVARSPVFAGMFRGGGPHDLTRVHVTDFSHATVERLVGFLYGDFPDLSSLLGIDPIRELYLASDLYRVHDLREACGRELVKRVTTDNVWPLVDLFYCHGDAEMAKRIADVCRRHVNVVVNTEGWKYVKARYPDFSGMVLESLAKVTA